MNAYKFITVIFTILLPVNSMICQELPERIPMPTQQNKIIIDQIMKVTEYPKYVEDFCIQTIKEASEAEKWDTKTKQIISKTINYHNFRDAVYNMFASYSEKDLEELLLLYKQHEYFKQDNVMIKNHALGYNLEIFANDIVRGRYK